MLPQLPNRQPFQSAESKKCETSARANTELAQRLFPAECSVFQRRAVLLKQEKKISVGCVNAEKHNVIVSSVAPISP